MTAKKSKKPKKPSETWVQERHQILGGKAEIFRVKQSGLVWQFRMWIPAEKRAVRKSLKTRDTEAALQRAEEEVFKVHSDVASGRKLFGMSLSEVVERYLAWRWEDTLVQPPLITPGRHSTIQSQLKHFLAYKRPDMKMSELDRNSFYDYRVWRMKTKNAQAVTVRNEEATINHLMSFAYREGMSHFDSFSFRRFKIQADDIGRRDDFSIEEYDQLVKYLRSYVAKKNCPDEKERSERLMVRDAILLASNTLLRNGELWQLQWRDIERVETIESGKKKPVKLVHINVRAETSKVRASRKIISRGGEYVERLKSNQEGGVVRPYEFLFGGESRYPKKKWYDHWRNLMNGIGIEDYQERKLTWYSLRHFGIRMRILAGLTYEEIALMAGSSPQYIMSHYYHPDDPEKKAAALKNFYIDKDGILVR